MKKYDYVIFDLDGTLSDPSLGITNSLVYALKRLDTVVENRDELLKFIGPPLTDSFQRYFGFSEEKTGLAIKYYREYFKDKGIFENSVYDEIGCLLSALKENGKKLLVATTKPEIFAIDVLKHFNLDGYFEFIAGSHLDGRRVDKEELIRYALRSSGIEDLEHTIMIGDREYDIIGAKKVGIDSVGVLYGFGHRKELEEAGAKYIVASPMDLLEILK